MVKKVTNPLKRLPAIPKHLLVCHYGFASIARRLQPNFANKVSFNFKPYLKEKMDRTLLRRALKFEFKSVKQKY